MAMKAISLMVRSEPLDFTTTICRQKHSCVFYGPAVAFSVSAEAFTGVALKVLDHPVVLPAGSPPSGEVVLWTRDACFEPHDTVVSSVPTPSMASLHPLVYEACIYKHLGPHSHLPRSLGCWIDPFSALATLFPHAPDLLPTDTSTVALVLQYVKAVPLTKLFMNFCILPMPFIRGVVRNLIDLLGWMHKKGVVYCDVKLTNVLVDGNGKIWLVDLGSAVFVGSFADSASLARVLAGRVTEHLRPPELSGHAIGAEINPQCVDAWGVGALLVELLTGKIFPSFRDQQSHAEVLEESLRCIFGRYRSNHRCGSSRMPSCWRSSTDPQWCAIDEFLRGILHFNPAHRFGASTSCVPWAKLCECSFLGEVSASTHDGMWMEELREEVEELTAGFP